MGRAAGGTRDLGTVHLPTHKFIVLGFHIGESKRGIRGTGIAGGNVKTAGLGGEGPGGFVFAVLAGNGVIHFIFRAA